MDLLTANDRPGEYPPSYYAATANPFPHQPALGGEVRADVCVIGAGFTGLSAALHLAEKGYSVAVLEASRAGFGASGRNGGQIATGPRQDIRDLEKTYGPEMGRHLWEFAEEAKAVLRGRVAQHDIACDLKRGAIHGEMQARNVADAHAYAEHCRDVYDYDEVTLLDREAIRQELGTEAYQGGFLDMGAGHLHPLNYALGLASAALAAGVQIFEESRVLRVSEAAPHRVETAGGHVTCDFVIYACNGYMGDLEPKVSARVMPINNFIAATEPLDEALAQELIARDVCVADSQFVVNYYRLSADRRMLFGGGETYSYRFPRDIPGLVRPRMEAVYPQLKKVAIDYAWGGTLGITASRMPYFDALGPTRFTAGGYSGQGVAMTSLAGKVLAERVAGQAERFDTLKSLKHIAFPGGGALRHPLLVLAMSWYALRDRLGV
ncbi:NAD(P)/FAD-dependent oxidoreductase [Algicella marina]|uniref:FAD-dependent oxidoreductase n=1 Tax=Algicella marina TaxID=2683284 RepID=A0A6P1T2I2_9RHOB|nr:FAD-binding oxidoreductase [Algicella marina]QHQ37144.1 FAD-dependent oxidoreductase [Algicella marina]